MPIVSINEAGAFVLSLPNFLRSEQQELEQMVGRILSDPHTCAANLPLAQQLSINWCVAKAKKRGITDKCFCGTQHT